jgi:hypothetical protein
MEELVPRNRKDSTNAKILEEVSFKEILKKQRMKLTSLAAPISSDPAGTKVAHLGRLVRYESPLATPLDAFISM